ncbi:MAG: molybdate ABC transporter permease subunit [Oscillospiraceae bacterium]|nr:molybdate ABC transporter permease subunit [Oscillospiraceae bacterium]
MDLFPLWNSLRIAAISALLVFLLGVAAARWVSKAPRGLKAALDVLFTLPLVLPPTVVGYLLILLLGPEHALGAALLRLFGAKILMRWWAAVLAVSVVVFPLMYRTARGAFESFNEDLADAGRTLGLSDAYIFWHIRMPVCRPGIAAGLVLAFARALGEYGATSMVVGFIPGRTATVATQVAFLWQNQGYTEAGRRALLFWICINVAISAAVLVTVNLLERRSPRHGS